MNILRQSQNSDKSPQQLTRNRLAEDEVEDIVSSPTNSYKYIYLIIGVIILLFILGYINNKFSKNDQINFRQTLPLPLKNNSQMIQISHDTDCYTQGLSFLNRTHMLQSCGLYSQSYFHVLQYNDQENILKEVYKSTIFDKSIFLEGSIKFPINNCIYILTWKENLVFKINGETFEEISRMKWQKQGWGLTHNNSHLIISDGSHNIYIVDESLTILQTIPIVDQNQIPIIYLNELQWVSQGQRQFVYANIWLTDKILKIDLSNGKIIKTYNFTPLVVKQRAKKHYQVLNGIAYHTYSQKFIITGKQWGSLYRLDNLEYAL